MKNNQFVLFLFSVIFSFGFTMHVFGQSPTSGKPVKIVNVQTEKELLAQGFQPIGVYVKTHQRLVKGEGPVLCKTKCKVSRNVITGQIRRHCETICRPAVQKPVSRPGKPFEISNNQPLKPNRQIIKVGPYSVNPFAVRTQKPPLDPSCKSCSLYIFLQDGKEVAARESCRKEACDKPGDIMAKPLRPVAKPFQRP